MVKEGGVIIAIVSILLALGIIANNAPSSHDPTPITLQQSEPAELAPEISLQPREEWFHPILKCKVECPSFPLITPINNQLALGLQPG